MSYTPGSGAVITVGVDGAAGSRREIDTVGDALRRLNDSNFQKLSGQMTALQGSVGGLKSAFQEIIAFSVAGFGVGSFVSMIRGSIDAADHLKDLSKSTNIAVADLAGLKLAAQQSGGDLDGIADVINKLAVNMGKDPERFRRLGISAKEPIEAFKQMADVLNAIQDPYQRSAVAAQALGKSWASASPLMAEGSEKIGQMIEKGKALSGVTQEAADKADEFNDKMAEMEAAVSGAKMKLASEMLPALTEVANAVSLALDESGKLQAVWVALGALGAFAFTDQFSSATVKLKNLQGELDVIKNYQLNAKESVPILGYLLWGNESAWDAEIAAKKQEIAALIKSTGDAATARTAQQAAAADAAAKAKESQAVKDAAAAATAFLKTSEAASKASLATQLQKIQYGIEVEKNIRAEGLAAIGELNRQGLVSDAQYYAAKYQTALAAGADTAKVKQAEIAALASYHATDAADQIATNGKIAKLNAEKNEALRSSLVAAQQLRAKYLYDSGAVERAAQAAADAEIDAANKESASLELQFAGYDKLAPAVTAVAIAKLQARGAALESGEGLEWEIAKNNQLIEALKTRAGWEARVAAQDYTKQLAQENKRFIAESIFDERQRAVALIEIDADLWRQRLGQLVDGTDAKKTLQSEYDAWYRNQLLKPQLDEERRMWASIEQAAHDTFLSFGDSAKAGAQRAKDALKNGLFDWLYQMTIKKWIFNIGASTSMAGIPGMAQAAGEAGGMGSALGTAGNIYSAVSGGMTLAGGLGTGFMGSVSGGLMGAGAGSGLGSAAGLAVGEGIAGVVGPQIAGALSSGMSMLAAAAPYLAAAMAVYAVWKTLDTSGTYHTGGASSASAAGVTSVRAESLNFEATQVSAETQKMTAALASGIVNILDSTASAFGKTAGYTAATAFADDTSKDGAWGGLVISKLGEKILDWQDTKTGSWAPKVFADGDAGKAEYLAALSKSVRTALDGIGLPSWAQTMLDGLGEGASLDEMAKVVDGINVTQRALVVMGDKLKGFSDLSEGAVSALIAAAGGIDSLAAGASAYYDKFYSDAEKTTGVTKQLTEAFAKVGLAMPATIEAYRAELEAQMALGEAAAPTVAVLFKNAGAFADLHPALEAVANSAQSAADALAAAEAVRKEQRGLDIQLMTATGNAEGALAATRKDAIAALLSDQARVTQQQIWAAEETASAIVKAQESAAAIRKEQHALDIQLLTALGDAEGALAATRQDALEAMLSDQARLTQQQIWAADAAADAIAKAKASADEQRAATKSAYVDLGNALLNSMNSATAAAKAWLEFNDSLKLGNLSALSKGAQYDVAKQAYGANPTDEATASAFLQASQEQGGSKLDYARDFAMVIANNSAAAAEKQAAAAAIPAFWAMVSSMQADGSHADGLNYVPFDGYRAILHKGESVRTAEQTRNGDSSTAARENTAVLREVLAELRASGRHSKTTATILQSVTRGGESLVTVPA
jgi:hypothetical protein